LVDLVGKFFCSVERFANPEYDAPHHHNAIVNSFYRKRIPRNRRRFSFGYLGHCAGKTLITRFYSLKERDRQLTEVNDD
jgi:hypothetical protein